MSKLPQPPRLPPIHIHRILLRSPANALITKPRTSKYNHRSTSNCFHNMHPPLMHLVAIPTRGVILGTTFVTRSTPEIESYAVCGALTAAVPLATDTPERVPTKRGSLMILSKISPLLSQLSRYSYVLF